MTEANASKTNITDGYVDNIIQNDENCTNSSENKTSILTHINCNDTVLTQASIQNNSEAKLEVYTEEAIIDNTIDLSSKDKHHDKDVAYSKYKVVEKTKGHYKNSLKRKRRSNYVRAPLIVNYETIHAPESNNDGINQIHIPLPNGLSQIKDSGVANFVIETLHEPNNSEQGPTTYRGREDSSPLHYSETPHTHHSGKPQRKVNNENINYDNEYNRNSTSKDVSDDIEEDQPSSLNNSNENYRAEINTSQSSKQRIEANSEEATNSNEDVSNSAESTENNSNSYERKNNKENINDSNNSNNSQYDSNESIETTPDDKNKVYPTAGENLANLLVTTASTIQEVDLGDFSYERIRVKDNGEVEAIQDNNESNEKDEINDNKNTENTTDNDNNPMKYFSETDLNKQFGKQIKINTEEIKPVIEINSEEPSEEKDNRSNENLSFEFVPFNAEGTREEQIQDDNNSNAKQQFERIPLDYKHEKESEEAEREERDPPGEELDKNLNIKFGDITLDLPDIKLPENILQVNDKKTDDSAEENDEYQNSKSEENESEEGQVSNDDDSESEEKSDNGDNHNKFYSANYFTPEDNNSNEEEENNEDEEEDLYEKFVRERFGKQGSFKSRYSPEKQFEKLQQRPINPELHSTIKQILNKTKDTSRQAEKSNDPNAGYMWTLEYGEQL